MSDSRVEQRRYLEPTTLQALASSSALPIQFLNTLSHFLSAGFRHRCYRGLSNTRALPPTHVAVTDSADILVPSIWYQPP